MTFFQAIILGIAQGLTEFLPVSSSAHLVLIPYWLDWKIPEAQIFPFDVLVQLGTLAAVITYFWQDLWSIARGFLDGLVSRKPYGNPSARMGWYLILATIPAGMFGLMIKSQVEEAFQSASATGGFLFVTAILLVVAEMVGKRKRRLPELNWKDALWIGVGQALSVFPGISRSGATISTGMIRNFERPAAARFSFLLSIPVMLAAGILEARELISSPDFYSLIPLILTGFTAAAVVGYVSIHWLLKMLNRLSLIGFALYCIAAGTVTLIINNFR